MVSADSADCNTNKSKMERMRRVCASRRVLTGSVAFADRLCCRLYPVGQLPFAEWLCCRCAATPALRRCQLQMAPEVHQYKFAGVFGFRVQGSGAQLRGSD